MGSLAGSMGGQIAQSIMGSVIGGMGAKADRKAKADSDALNALGYTDARPYITRGYEGGEKALNDALETGYYSGPTFADLTPEQIAALNNRSTFGNSAFSLGGNLMNQGANYGNNLNALYSQAGQDELGNAQQYALNNNQPLIDAAMRGANRNLNEVQLTGNNTRASGSGNMNSSRAGTAEAILRRGNAEQYADTASTVNRGLMGDYLNQSQNRFGNLMSVNNAMGNLVNNGYNLANTGSNMALGSGDRFQSNDQARMNDTRSNFDGARDFASDQYSNFMSGVLGRAPMSPPGSTPNYFNPAMGAVSGGMAGYGMGGQQSMPFQSNQSYATTQPGFNGGFNPLLLNYGYSGGMI